jgi:thioesterase domain-containing protein
MARYNPVRATFPVVLYQSTGSSAARFWQPLVPDLRVVDCDGDHLSMLEPPHVERLAADVADRLAQLGRTPDTAA